MDTTSLDWQTSCKAYLERLAQAEYLAQKKAAKGKKTWHYSPSDYHRLLIECLNRNEEEAFKATKGLQGYASALGV
jgi:hypothetical protein